MRTTANIANLCMQVDDAITKWFIPCVYGRIKYSDVEKSLLSLPRRMGTILIFYSHITILISIFSETADFECANAILVTKTLTRKIINQERQYGQNSRIKEIKNKIIGMTDQERQYEQNSRIKEIKNKITGMTDQERQYEQNSRIKEIKNKITGMTDQCHNDILKNIKIRLSEHQRLNNVKQESGASVWISPLLLENEDYAMTKQVFWDLIRFRCEWKLKHLPETYACRSTLLQEICSNFQIETQIQHFSGE